MSLDGVVETICEFKVNKNLKKDTRGKTYDRKVKNINP